MPASAVHYYFINSLIKNDKHQDIISLAGQGPDPFFFYGFSLHKRANKQEVQKFGTLLHHIDPYVVYEFIIQYALKEKKHRGLLLSFARGFMYHYCLDRNLHPYIFYISGFSNNDNEKKYYSFKHGEVESALDAIFINKFNISKTIPQMIEVKDEELKVISLMLSELASKIFQNNSVDKMSYYYGVKDMQFVYKHINAGLLGFIVKNFMKNNIANALRMPNYKDYEKYDLLNEQGNKWRNCVNGNIRFESLFDLIENAKRDAGIVDSIIMHKIDATLESKLKSFTKNIDHDGFIVNSEKKYFELKIK